MRPFQILSSPRRWLRRLRGYFYRRSWGGSRQAHQRRRKGFERRCGAEEQGHTMESWLRFLRDRGMKPARGAVVLELAAGDGRVGSLGAWFEGQEEGVTCFLWEHRAIPLRDAVRQRPAARVTEGRLLDWSLATLPAKPWIVISTCSRQTARVWQAVRRGEIHPAWVVVWNPTGRSAWWRRARRAGYRLRWVHANREYYRSP